MAFLLMIALFVASSETARACSGPQSSTTAISNELPKFIPYGALLAEVERPSLELRTAWIERPVIEIPVDEDVNGFNGLGTPIHHIRSWVRLSAVEVVVKRTLSGVLASGKFALLGTPTSCSGLAMNGPRYYLVAKLFRTQNGRLVLVPIEQHLWRPQSLRVMKEYQKSMERWIPKSWKFVRQR
jgi:hypothetical protein